MSTQNSPLTQRPFEVLSREDVSPDKKRSYERTDANFVKRLADKIGNVGAGKEIGVSDTTIANAIENGYCLVPHELAARYIYERDYSVKAQSKTVAAIVTGELNMLKTLQQMIAIGGGSFTFIELNK